MEIVNLIRPYAELASFLANGFLIVGLIVAALQLKELKRDLVVRTERSAKERALEAVDRYATQAVKEFNALINKLIEQGIAPAVVNLHGEAIPKDQLDIVIELTDKNIFAAAALNELEVVAVYFTEGIADEDVGFRVIGKSFCFAVDNLSVFIAVMQCGERHAPYSATIKLYDLWRPRLNKQDLIAASQEIQAQVQALGPDRTIKPIGRA